MCETPLHALWAADRTQLRERVHENNGGSGIRDGTCDGMRLLPKEKNIRVVVHGDDFIIEGAEYDLRWVEATLRKKYIVKMRAMLGLERTDDKVADILKRVVEWKDDELWYEADPRHVEKMLNDMELGECKESVVPGTKTTEEEDDNEQLDVGVREEVQVRRRAWKFLGPGSTGHPEKRERALPRDVEPESREAGRYLKGTPRVVQKVKIGADLDNVVNVYVDSD